MNIQSVGQARVQKLRRTLHCLGAVWATRDIHPQFVVQIDENNRMVSVEFDHDGTPRIIGGMDTTWNPAWDVPNFDRVGTLKPEEVAELRASLGMRVGHVYRLTNHPDPRAYVRIGEYVYTLEMTGTRVGASTSTYLRLLPESARRPWRDVVSEITEKHIKTNYVTSLTADLMETLSKQYEDYVTMVMAARLTLKRFSTGMSKRHNMPVRDILKIVQKQVKAMLDE